MVYAENRKARHEYATLETFEAGLVLSGQETKSIREGGAKLQGAYLTIRQGELWLLGCHIAPYSKAGKLLDYDPSRARKALVQRRELLNLATKLEQKGLTLVPFSLYPRGHRVKLSFSLCRGKKAYDKRESLKARDVERRLRQSQYGRDED